MRIAIVGTGISGLVTAHLLAPEHDVHVFEAADRIGGHTHTVAVEIEGVPYAVDTGFIVFNDRTYPDFTKLLATLGVASQPTEMSFSVRCERTGLEYAGTSLNALFAQRRNLLRPGFHRMLADVLRFNHASRALVDGDDPARTLGEVLDAGGYSRAFVEHYLIPMASAVWSAPLETVRRFPAHSLVRFFANHGLLSLGDRPQWRTLCGGSRAYLAPLTARFAGRIRLRAPVREIVRDEHGVTFRAGDGAPERFDRVVLACHSDEALRALADPSPQEREILGAIPYQPNEVVLHTDERLLPKRRRARASWNYHLLRRDPGRAAVTYHMNRLQRLDAPVELCVTLNRPDAVDPSRVLGRFVYHHPVYTPESALARRRRGEIDGVRRTHYCGAYWGYGFHEDGVRSALDVAARFGASL